jgi:hypothetical protein
VRLVAWRAGVFRIWVVVSVGWAAYATAVWVTIVPARRPEPFLAWVLMPPIILLVGGIAATFALRWALRAFLWVLRGFRFERYDPASDLAAQRDKPKV